MPKSSAEAALASGRRRSRLSLAGRFDEAALRVCNRLVGASMSGRVRIGLPSGTSAVIGQAEGCETIADLHLKRYRAFWRCLRGGSIGFAESYMAGDVDSDDILVLLRHFLANRGALRRSSGGWFNVRSRDRKFHERRANSRSGSRENISAHYDLGNEFYRLWLDPSMTYSSGLYSGGVSTLEEAQQAKYRLVLDGLLLEPGHRLLEIGCGWGAMAAAAAARGANVTALTLSQEQLSAARSLVACKGLSERVDVRLQDYRDVAGVYDRVVSIEMIEAVGEENWPRYFATLRERLAPGGIVVLQAITIDEPLFDTYRRQADFIQRYIFPGGLLPTKSSIGREARQAGLECETLKAFGASYALTLSEWRRRFNANWRQIAALGFDERFRRMWDYYLAYCQAGFESGTIDVGLYRLRHSG